MFNSGKELTNLYHSSTDTFQTNAKQIQTENNNTKTKNTDEQLLTETIKQMKLKRKSIESLDTHEQNNIKSNKHETQTKIN